MKIFTLKFAYISFALFLSVVLVTVSCNKKNGDGVLLEEEEEPIDEELLTGTITEPLTLYNRVANPNQYDYKVPSSVVIASKLTVMPGVMIEMGAGAKMTVTSQGQLRLMGTPDSNVVITGKQKNHGYWDYIMINSYDSVNQIKHTVIEYGGGNPNQTASLILNGTSMLKMHYTTIQHSERYGMSVLYRDSRLLNFYNNTIKECGFAPLLINSSQMSSIDNTILLDQQNTYNHIEVKGSDVYYPLTWQKTDVPFYMTDATTIHGDLIIAPGARLVFGPAGRILVKETGSISAIGEETDSIYFSGAQNIAGYWDCILFLSNNPYNEFKYVSMHHGGGYWYWNASIYLQDAFFKISHSTVANSARWGIYRNGVYNFENGGFNNFYNNATGPVGP